MIAIYDISSTESSYLIFYFFLELKFFLWIQLTSDIKFD